MPFTLVFDNDIVRIHICSAIGFGISACRDTFISIYLWLGSTRTIATWSTNIATGKTPEALQICLARDCHDGRFSILQILQYCPRLPCHSQSAMLNPYAFRTEWAKSCQWRIEITKRFATYVDLIEFSPWVHVDSNIMQPRKSPCLIKDVECKQRKVLSD